jgi:hypothetical protein
VAIVPQAAHVRVMAVLAPVKVVATAEKADQAPHVPAVVNFK